MNNLIYKWLLKPKDLLQKTVLIIDTCASPNPITELFANGLSSLKNFICLYKDTELANNLESSPWLIELNNDFSINQISYLLENPEINWGWLASMDASFTLEQLAKHWQQRMIVEEENRKFIYRFQDNRTISWHLQNLLEVDIPLLLGPIHSVLAWNGTQWQSYSNEKPELCFTLSRTPWVDISESDSVAKAIRYENMRNWLFSHYINTIYEFSEIEHIHEWLEEQLLLADQWHWDKRNQWEFLIGQRLDPKQRESSDWLPLENELPVEHYRRCQSIFNKPLDYIETYIETDKL